MSKGLESSSDKILALTKMSEPEKKSELETFLSIIVYIANREVTVDKLVELHDQMTEGQPNGVAGLAWEDQCSF